MSVATFPDIRFDLAAFIKPAQDQAQARDAKIKKFLNNILGTRPKRFCEMSGSEASVEKDIELVLVTGAGATYEFGLQSTKVPTMAEWSDALVEKISKASWSYVAATGLAEGLGGPEFERRLSRFLRQVSAFSQISSILAPSLNFQPADLSIADQTLSRWHTRTAFHLSKITDLIHESLYENFSGERIDLDAASNSYARLLRDLGIGNTDSLVDATTNYDPVGEYAIEQFGGLPDWGAPRHVRNPGSSLLRVDRIIDGLPRYVPVLHLHGRVGWYRRQDGGILHSADAARHEPGSGIPFIMQHDPDQAYNTEPVIRSLWEQFEQALRRARRVFVLGHSLNDRALVESLRKNISPPHRLAVGLLARKDDPGQIDQTATSTINVLREFLPAAGMITVRFGPDPIISAYGVRTWTERIKETTGLSG
jgi:hypothetical protein